MDYCRERCHIIYTSSCNLCTACGNESFRYDGNNRLTEFNGKPVVYDADGNMLSASIGEFTYDSDNRLITADTRYYAYDVEGTRIKTQRGEDVTKFVYNVNARLSQLLVMTENNAETKYVYGLGLIGEEVSGSFKTYHFDYRGSTVAITNASGTVTDTFEYDTYGKLKDRTGTTKTPFLYNGRDGVMYEEDTGLYYMRARYYSPALRRFVNADKVHGDISNALTLNRYSFCNGDPANGVDPEGLCERDASAINKITRPIASIVAGSKLFTGAIHSFKKATAKGYLDGIIDLTSHLKGSHAAVYVTQFTYNVHCRSPPPISIFKNKIEIGGFFMVKINLREYYPQYYTKDVYILVEDDVAEAFEESKRKAKAENMENYRHRNYRSFDCSNSLEVRISKSDFISPLAEFEERYMPKKLYETLSTITQEQQRRIYAKYFLGLSNTDMQKQKSVMNPL